jgi:ribosome-associated toxin RatA of RatAB toxin-antitoxin module
MVLILAATMFLGRLAYGQDSKPPIDFAVTRSGEFVQTEAHVDMPVSPAVAWEVLTDYEQYPRFISSMRQSKIVSRGREGVIVEQKGSFSFLFFSQDINVHLRVSELPETLVEARAIDGDFRVMDGRYELTSLGNNVRLTYSGRLVPNFTLPPIFGLSIVRHILFSNFSELVNEILRRGAEARAVSSAG